MITPNIAHLTGIATSFHFKPSKPKFKLYRVFNPDLGKGWIFIQLGKRICIVWDCGLVYDYRSNLMYHLELPKVAARLTDTKSQPYLSDLSGLASVGKDAMIKMRHTAT